MVLSTPHLSRLAAMSADAEAASFISALQDLRVVNLAAGSVHDYNSLPSFTISLVAAGATAWVGYDILITIKQEVSSIIDYLCTIQR